MKKLITTLLIISTIFFSGCEKKDYDATFGSISFIVPGEWKMLDTKEINEGFHNYEFVEKNDLKLIVGTCETDALIYSVKILSEVQATGNPVTSFDEDGYTSVYFEDSKGSHCLIMIRDDTGNVLELYDFCAKSISQYKLQEIIGTITITE